ncbi:MAG TPA: cytidine deaminase [Clostridiales bacterium]|nr:cytidine deaminase [Clostridiales bacterium]
MLMEDKYPGLIEAAKSAYKNSYSPYSGYAVGAAILCSDGSIYSGTNVESAALPAGICAERSALASAVSDGKRGFVAVAVYSKQISTPCGMCRQLLAEFGDMQVICAAQDGTTKFYSLSALLPEAFLNLKQQGR